jgi:SNF2 family DNA or RNA helicase
MSMLPRLSMLTLMFMLAFTSMLTFMYMHAPMYLCMQNDLMELWSLMHFLMPAVFASHAQVCVSGVLSCV